MAEEQTTPDIPIQSPPTTPDTASPVEAVVEAPANEPAGVTPVETAAETADAPAETASADGAAADAAEGEAKDKPAKGEATTEAKGDKDEAKGEAAKKAAKRKRRPGPEVKAVLQRIGKTPESAIAYLSHPEPSWRHLPHRFMDDTFPELPPVTQGALLGPDALCRHFLASAATGRYRDLFYVWDVFKQFPDQCKPVLMSRPEAQQLARAKMEAAVHFNLLGHAEQLAADITRASGLPWTWLKEILERYGVGIAQRPVVIDALWRKDPTWPIDIPEQPTERWLVEALSIARYGVVPQPINDILIANLDSLPVTIQTLQLALAQVPERVHTMLESVPVTLPSLPAIMRWARDNNVQEVLTKRLSDHLVGLMATSRWEALQQWHVWVDFALPLPAELKANGLDDLPKDRMATARLAKVLESEGQAIDAQAIIDELASTNRNSAEKAYEAYVVAGFDQVKLPESLRANEAVKATTRCPKCEAWTWVRPGHDQRCPRPDVLVIEDEDITPQP